MKKEVAIAVLAAVLIVAVGAGLVYGFALSVPRERYNSLERSYSGLLSDHATLQEEKDNLATRLDVIEAKYPLRNFASKRELEDWIDDHLLPKHSSDAQAFDNALQTQIAARIAVAAAKL